MTYRVDFHAAALAQLDGLPPAAFDALVDYVVKLKPMPLSSI
jgi:mRNA-degrading endonuclease RelE of RelBE toxin-antitoxin system